jgi:hypothetical protein
MRVLEEFRVSSEVAHLEILEHQSIRGKHNEQALKIMNIYKTCETIIRKSTFMLKSTTLQGLSGMNPEIFLPI